MEIVVISLTGAIFYGITIQWNDKAIEETEVALHTNTFPIIWNIVRKRIKKRASLSPMKIHFMVKMRGFQFLSSKTSLSSSYISTAV